MTGEWREIADQIYVLRYPVLDVNATVVVGEALTLVVDTLSTPSQASELVEAIRTVTALPWVVVNTHHHFDHAYGNQVFTPCQIWAHEEAVALLRSDSAGKRRALYDEYAGSEPVLSAELRDVTVVAPNHMIRDTTPLDLGNRAVTLRHLGRGHTAGDLVVQVPDADILIAGDLVEQGGPPSFEDSYPLEWPHTVAKLLRLITGPVVPGHGTVVDREFVMVQHEALTRLSWLIREGHADAAPGDKVARQAPFPEQTARIAVRRGYAELSGRV
ncbi:MAG TPA: MBL fold metallo-hydrolase [Micromonosporaceae bacterium]|nr:MBL fold metallo-hydrolase [Micromonosporaceae bacterium]